MTASTSLPDTASGALQYTGRKKHKEERCVRTTKKKKKKKRVRIR
jgi:hypothetical protein